MSSDSIRLIWWLICARTPMCLILFRLDFVVILGLCLLYEVQLALGPQRSTMATFWRTSFFESCHEILHGLVNLLVFGGIQSLSQIVESQLSAHLVANVLHHNIVLIIGLDLFQATQELLLSIIYWAIRIISGGVDAASLDSMREVAVILLRCLPRRCLWSSLETSAWYHIVLIKPTICILTTLSDVAIILLLHISFVFHWLIPFLDLSPGLFLSLRSYLLELALEFRRRVAIAHWFNGYHTLTCIGLLELLLLNHDLFLLLIQHL